MPGVVASAAAVAAAVAVKFVQRAVDGPLWMVSAVDASGAARGPCPWLLSSVCKSCK